MVKCSPMSCFGGVLAMKPSAVFRQMDQRCQLNDGQTLKSIAVGSGREVWKHLETGGIGPEEFERRFSEILSKEFGRPIDVTGMLQLFNDSVQTELVHYVKLLRRSGFKTALLTNNWYLDDSRRRSLQPFPTSYFDVIVESCRVGFRKPDARIYQLVLDKLMVRGEEAVFLDDIGQNLKAAKSFGIHTIKVDDPSKAAVQLDNLLQLPTLGTCATTEKMAIDAGRLVEYLEKVGVVENGLAEPVVRWFKHGQSNPTYLVFFDPANCFVLRKKPPGKLLPSAHAVEREFQIMKAVEAMVPVPKMVHLCEHSDVIGTPFYLMEHVRGFVYKNPRLDLVPPAQRKAYYRKAMEVLSKIHSVPVSSIQFHGKAENYLQRNLKRWVNQYEATKTGDNEKMNRLIDWLKANIPPERAATLVHGDYRMDNLIFDGSGQVMATIDWEMSTIGDPLTDLATFCAGHYFPADFPMLSGLSGTDLQSLSVPDVSELIAMYEEYSGAKVEHWSFYVSFTLFRFASILQGVFARSQQGQDSGSKAHMAGLLAQQTVEIALKVIDAATDAAAAMTDKSVDNQNGLAISIDQLSERVQKMHEQIRWIVNDEIVPLEKQFLSTSSWDIFQPMEPIKAKAKSMGLWNLFIPNKLKQFGGAGLTNTEYAFLCEQMGRSLLAPEVFNCSAPDTGNMEVLMMYGSESQRRRWLQPLLDGQIRSCFGMTEPDVASSDATNMSAEIRKQPNGDYVVNGRKWWTSGAMHPKCAFCVFMGRVVPALFNDRHKQHSMVIVPMDAAGVEVVRPLQALSSYDQPGGHAEVMFANVRVPSENVILGDGRGFEIAQGRLGPGRIHHCMRLIGSAERAVELMTERAMERKTFGKPIMEHGSVAEMIGRSRVELEQLRLLVLKAAYLMDCYGNRGAFEAITAAKIATPVGVQRIIDRAIQVFGAAGVCNDYPLALMFTWARCLRIADGPDEVHLRTMARLEARRVAAAKL